MDLQQLALGLMAVQAVLGAFDTLYHHELTEALPHRANAALELRLHAVRSSLYSLMFVGLAFWQWHGLWAWFWVGLFVVEILLTLWDFVVEDQTRALPATERITHTILTLNGGALMALLAGVMWNWSALPTAIVGQPLGWLHGFLVLSGLGVGVSALRDALAAGNLSRQQCRPEPELHWSAGSEIFLITGGTGFVGQALVRALLRQGQQPIVLARDPLRASKLFAGRVRCIQSLQELSAQQPVDVVINLAGARILGWPWTRQRRQQLLQSRLSTTQRLLDWLSQTEQPPRLWLNASAIGYYGIQPAGSQTELDETAPPQALFMSELCQQWEQRAQRAREFGVPVVCLRFGLVLGHGGALPMMLLPIRFGLGGRLGRGSQWLSWIHLDDLLAALAFLVRAPEPQYIPSELNLTAPEVVTQQQFSRIAARILHRPAILPTPGWLLTGLLGEQAQLLTEGQQVVPARLLASGFRFRFETLHSALVDLLD